MNDALTPLLSALASTRAERESLYTWFHQHPELSTQEVQTAARIRTRLDALGLAHTSVGETGTVCVLELSLIHI